MMLETGAQPCVNPACGTTGGYARHDSRRPNRTRGFCNACYDKFLKLGQFAQHALPAELNPNTDHPLPWPHLNDVKATGMMLWTTPLGKRQSHAVYGHHFDAHAEIVEARQDAALWLMEHPMTDLLDWPDPSLALFGAANAQADAA